ncbi:magnesium transporter [Mesoplasma corruscae]|uniref:Magnesium transporter MgtE n=1 Tax=Mesoplasma corruscae TaxID=216874 RepID=A0A2S5RGJ6_9MOLU|nr:magnesium transporter [Mesoplasma corruscae]PPE06456.1 Mg2+ transport protein [Mesoplasma corruscae]
MQTLEQIEQQLKLYLESKDLKSLRQMSKDTQYVDFAEAMERFESKDVLKIFRLLEVETAAEIFTYLDADHQEYIIQAFNGDEIKEIIDELYTDDIIDLIDEMPSEVVKKILKSTTQDVRKNINNILKYPEYSAGAIMSINFTELQEDMTVEMAIKAIKRRHEEYDEIDDLFVINKSNKLLGWLEIKQLIINDPKALLKDLMQTKIISVPVDMKQEEVAHNFKRYDINTLPVVDKNNELIGIITVDDVIDVLVEESTEDIQNFSGIDADDVDSDYFETSLFNMFKSRITSLSGILILGVITHILVSTFLSLSNIKLETKTQPFLLMVPIIIVVIGLCNTISTQISLMTIRSLSLNQIHKKEIKEILLKEALVSLLLAISLVLINLVRLSIVYLIEDQSISRAQLQVMLYSSLGIFICVLICNILGVILPIIFKKMKIDPSVFSTPVITTIVDIICVVCFFGLVLLV